MEQYKEKLKINLILYSICILVLAILALVAVLSEVGILGLAPAGDIRWQSMWRGIISGATCALLLMLVFGVVRILRALKDEKALKKLYIQEHDERSIQIWTSARAAAYQIFLLLGIVAGVAAGYFSMTVSQTILGCIFSASVLGLLCKVYFSRKF